MPCRSDMEDYCNDPAVQKELNQVTAFLCEMCRTSTEETLLKHPAVHAWWKLHEVADRARQAAEQAVAFERKKQAVIVAESEKAKESLKNKIKNGVDLTKVDLSVDEQAVLATLLKTL